MKTRIIFIILGLFLSTGSIAHENPINWEETLRVELNKLIGNQSFYFDQLAVSVSEKKISGTGTFFGAKGVQFQVSYWSEGKIGSFTAQIPEKAKVSISTKELTQLAGQDLKKLLPKAINKSVQLSGFGFTFSKTNKKVEKANLQFNCLKNWDLLKYAKFSLQKIKVDIDIIHPTEEAKRKVKGLIKGISKIGSVNFDLSSKLTKGQNDVEFTGDVKGLKLVSSLKSIVGKAPYFDFPLPDKMVNLSLKNTKVTVAPYQDWMTLKADSNLGKVDGFFQKNEQKKEGKLSYVVTINPPQGFKLSKLDSKLSVMDGLDLSKLKIVLSSEKKKKKETSKIPNLAQIKSGIRKGASMVMKLDIRKLKLEHLLKVKDLVLNSPLSAKLNDIVLETELDSDIEFSPTMKLQNTVFRLKPSPKDFQISILGVMDTQIEKDQLEFKGGVEVVLTDQSINFVSMMDGDWNAPFGAKGLKMSDVGLQVGASLVGGLPNVALGGEMKVGRFNGDAAVAFDSRNPAKSMLQASFDKLVYWDLIEMVISKKVSRSIPKDLKKTLRSLYLTNVEMQVVPTPVQVLDQSYNAGFRVAGGMNILGTSGQAELDIDYGNGVLASGSVDPLDLGVFKLAGAKGKKRPELTIDLRKGKQMKIVLNGMVSMLGVSAETDVEVLPNGFSFKLGGKLFNVFNGSIMASGRDLAKAGDMQLKVKMNNDILGFIDREATKAIENSTGGAIKKLSAAQKKLSDAQKKVKQLDREIAIARKEVKAKQKAKRAAYDAANKQFTKWQTEVNKLDKKIKKLKKEKSKLKKHQVVKKSWYNTQIASTATLRKTAWLALEGPKKILDGLKWVNQDPDKHAKVMAVKTKKNTALVSLEAAKLALEGLKKTLGAIGKAGTFIVDKGAKAMINIRKVDFAGKLGSISGGGVKLNLDMEWLGKKQKIKLNFNLKNPAQSIKALVKKLMKK